MNCCLNASETEKNERKRNLKIVCPVRERERCNPLMVLLINKKKKKTTIRTVMWRRNLVTNAWWRTWMRIFFFSSIDVSEEQQAIERVNSSLFEQSFVFFSSFLFLFFSSSFCFSAQHMTRHEGKENGKYSRTHYRIQKKTIIISREFM